MLVSTDLSVMPTHYYLDWATVWREVNVILALIAIACMLKNLIFWHRYWTHQERSITWGAIILAGQAIVESGYSAFREREFSIMIPALSIALLFLIAGSFHTPTRVAEFRALKQLSKECSLDD